MAGVDLYGGDASRIRDTYRTRLGRDASDDEVSGWLSGSYGGGGVDSWVTQIANSGEAQQRQPAQEPRQPDPATVNTGFSQPQGDPWEQARQGLSNTYQQHLGRQASQDELNNWLSGSYGYGGGLENYDKYVNAIMGSHEARNYRPQGNPNATGGNQTLEYWQSQGVPAIDIFDPLTGQMKAGWQRTATGYGRTGATGGTATVSAPPNGDFQSWFMGLTNGRAPSPQSLEAMAPMLAQYGIRLGPRNARGFTDGIILPNGQFIDVITAATETGGTGWSWQTGGGGVGGGQLPGNQYSDPYTQLLEMLMKSRLGQLQQPVNDPYRQQLLAAQQARAQSLGNAAEPAYQALIQRLGSRVQDLQGPGYTGAENEAIRTQALDPIESDRTAARQRVLERLSARGITPDSGIAQQALLEVDTAFDGMRATSQTTLAVNDVQRREGRQQRADAIQGTLYDIPQARAREQLDVFGAMELLENVMRQEEEARSREAIGYGGALADLGPQRMQLAMQAAGMGGNPQGMFNSLMQMAQMNQNSALLNQRNSGQLWSGLGSLAYTLMNAGR
jgi:hypothetical protein